MIKDLFKYWVSSRKARQARKQRRTFATIVRDLTVPYLYDVMIPASKHLLFASHARCKGCDAGLAYFMGTTASEWDCSAVLLGRAQAGEKNADGTWKHPTYPFAFYEIKSEGQPSANGATTRPADIKPTRSYLLWHAITTWANNSLYPERKPRGKDASSRY